MIKHTTQVRVLYADTDQMKYVYNGKYFQYFEMGRTELLRSRGLTYKKVEEMGFFLPVREAHFKYKNPAFYDEILDIETCMKELPTAILHLDHTIRSVERNVIIAEGFIKLAFVDASTRRACRPPSFFIDAVKENFNV